MVILSGSYDMVMLFFFFNQKTAYEMRISDWSSDVCSSDLDLQGPKLRVGTFPDGPIRLEKGAAFRLELKPGPGNAQRATLPHPEIFAAIGPGTDLLLDDGTVRLRVVRGGKDFADTEEIGRAHV